jgi:flagellar hook-basal body complex protein FliE
MERSAIDSVLSQLRAAQSVAAGKPAGPRPEVEGAVAGASFGDVLKNSIGQVNSTQQQAAQMAKAYEMGTTDVNLNEVMVQMAKANISFQTMIQVRNRLVSAYHDMMNMQV